MGNGTRAAVVAVGVFMIGVAALSRFYAYPALAVAPADQVSESKSGGENATLFDAKTLKEVDLTLESVRKVRGDAAAAAKASEKLGRKVVVYDTAVTTDEPGYVLSQDDPPRSFSVSRVVLDARTGEAVKWDPKDGSGEFVSPTLEDKDRDFADDDKPGFTGHQGLVLKFPFGTEKKTYPFWDNSARKTFPMTFKAEEKIDGLTVYRFEQEVPTQTIGEPRSVPASVAHQPGNGTVEITRDYRNSRTVWVEPVTGGIVKGQEKQYSTLQYNGAAVQTATDATLAYTDETLKNNVKKYKKDARDVQIIKTWVPIGGLVLGLVLLLLGAGLYLRGDRTVARRAAG